MNSLKELQEKYNDIRDRGKTGLGFIEKNKLLGDEHKKLREELEKNYQALEEKRQKDPKERIKIISKRIKNYYEHKNDPYAYYPEEISEVRALLHHAPEDIEFLLNELKKAIVELEELRILAEGSRQIRKLLFKK